MSLQFFFVPVPMAAGLFSTMAGPFSAFQFLADKFLADMSDAELEHLLSVWIGWLTTLMIFSLICLGRV